MRSVVSIVSALLGGYLLRVAWSQSCAALNNCSGHGTCDTDTSSCICFAGWGAPTDVAVYKAPDCSLRTCPSDRAWADMPIDRQSAHSFAECSNAGLCDRSTGKCRCFSGFTGEACQRSACPGSPQCSGHGRCMSMAQIAVEPNAEPFGGAYGYGGNEDTTTWDENKIFGCVCDSAWEVGYGPGMYQQTQWFGADCSKKHCPSGDDPRTSINEEDCEYYDQNGSVWRGYIGSDGNKYKSLADMPNGVTAATSPDASVKKYDDPLVGASDIINAGAANNKCFVECSNRGICNYDTGMCTCFKGYKGIACEVKATLYS